ncbi:uncharacterized protein LOC131627099 [Vicia villosa]|uniref:uncharacterized protein LOC131627099 n=1 Tax=Vicia villosa TaxID=3911 RepID=UPI00273B61B6|nr:uncharacterized protein LOC131627099 [Vicia villosa]
MQSRNIYGYPQQQYYDNDNSWMETKAQQLQSHGYPQTQQYPGMKQGYGNESDYCMPNHHGRDSNHNMYHQDSKPYGHGNGHGHGYGGGQNDYVSEHKYEVYKEERIAGSGVTKRDEVRYERRGTYGGDANPYGYSNNPHGHGKNKGNWTLKGF